MGRRMETTNLLLNRKKLTTHQRTRLHKTDIMSFTPKLYFQQRARDCFVLFVLFEFSLPSI